MILMRKGARRKSSCVVARVLVLALSGCQYPKGPDVTTVSSPPESSVQREQPRVAPANDGLAQGTDEMAIGARAPGNGNGAGGDEPAPLVLMPTPTSPDPTVPPPPLASVLPIVFRSARAQNSTSNLYLMAADGSGVRQITHDGEFYLPKWSPDGTSILFRRRVEEPTPSADIGLVAADGSQRVMLTNGESPLLADSPINWSVDGQSLLLVSIVRSPPADSGAWLFTMSKNGSQRTRLFPGLRGEIPFQREGAWAPPDGSRVAYVEIDDAGVAQDVWLTTPSAAGPAINLTQGRVAIPTQLSWSPDGGRLAVVGLAYLPNGTLESDAGSHVYDYELFVIDVATLEVKQITDNLGDDMEPSWSPDGQNLMITSQRDGDYDIWLVPVDAPENARNLIDDNDDPHDDAAPSWYWGPR